MELGDLKIYQLAMRVGELVWQKTNSAEYIVKQTMSIQIIRSADSIAANISEGEGMFHYGDKKRFLYYARGSAFETKTWIEKLSCRNLIGSNESEEILILLNMLIKMINTTLYKLRNNS